jgi:hypothetical protein
LVARAAVVAEEASMVGAMVAEAAGKEGTVGLEKGNVDLQAEVSAIM